MTRPGLRTRLIYGARGQLIVTVLLIVASFAAQVGIARRFSLAGLGEYVGMTLAIFVPSVLAISGLPLAAGERIARHDERNDRTASRDTASTGFALTLALSVVAAILVVSCWNWLATTLGLGDRAWSPAVAAAIVGAGAVGYVPVVFQARLQIAAVGLIAIAQPFSVVVGLAWDTIAPGVRPATLAIIGYVSAGTVATILHFASGNGIFVSRGEVRPLVRQAMLSLPVLYANVFSRWTDRLLISILLGPAALGTYQAAAALIDGALRIPRASSSFLVTAYARVSAGDVNRVVAALAAQTRLWIVYATILAVGLIAGADGITATVFGAGSVTAAAPLRVLAVGLVPGTVALLLASAVTGASSAHIGVRVSLLTIPLQVLLMTVLAPRLGVLGASAAHLLTISVTAFVYAWWMSRHSLIAVGAGIRRPLVAVITALAVAALAAWLPLPWPVRVIAALALASAAIVRTLLRAEERALLRSLLAGTPEGQSSRTRTEM